MSTRWRIPTAAAAVLLMGAGPAAAPARATTTTPTTVYVGVVVDGPIAVAGHAYSMRGGLATATEPQAAVAGEPLEVQVRPAGQSAYRTIATLTTDSGGGVYTSSYRPRYTFSYRFHFAGDATYGPSYSGAVRVPVSPRVSLWLASYDVPRGGRIAAHGRTGPNRAGHLVRLYRGQTSRGGYGPSYPAPVLLASGRVHADGRYRLTGRARWKGSRRVFVEVSGGGLNTVGWSRYRWVTTH